MSHNDPSNKNLSDTDSRNKLSPDQRSTLMRRVRSDETAPEVLVRTFLFRAGFRYRKNAKELPGKPDIVLPKYNATIFVHGCFWHQHPGCKRSARPQTKQDYWNAKLDRNMNRDAANIARLQSLGWRVFVVWECELRPSSREQTLSTLVKNIKQ